MSAVTPDVPDTAEPGGDAPSTHGANKALRTDAKPPKVCPRCHLELLPSGPCAYCD